MRSGPQMRTGQRASLFKLLNWSIGEGYIDENVVLATNKHEEVARDRVFSDSELKAVWHSLPDGDYRDISRLLVLTGQRLREIGELSWSEMDFTRQR